MGDYYSVSGALILDTRQVELLKQLLSANEDQNPYVESWIFSDGGGMTYAFFGYELKEFALRRLRAQLQRIADTIQTQDADLEGLDYVEGRFWVVCPDEDPEYEWILADGQFDERLLAP